MADKTQTDPFGVGKYKDVLSELYGAEERIEDARDMIEEGLTALGPAYTLGRLVGSGRLDKAMRHVKATEDRLRALPDADMPYEPEETSDGDER